MVSSYKLVQNSAEKANINTIISIYGDVLKNGLSYIYLGYTDLGKIQIILDWTKNESLLQNFAQNISDLQKDGTVGILHTCNLTSNFSQVFVVKISNFEN